MQSRFPLRLTRTTNARWKLPNVEIIPASDELYRRAFSIYQERLDKEWGLIDCMSFIVMKDHALTDALTADNHFRQAGFTTLL